MYPYNIPSIAENEVRIMQNNQLNNNNDESSNLNNENNYNNSDGNNNENNYNNRNENNNGDNGGIDNGENNNNDSSENNNRNNREDVQNPENNFTPSNPHRAEPNPYIIEMVVDAVKAEDKDSAYYKKLSQMTPSEEDKDILYKIHLDEEKHKKMFEDIYYQLIGENINIKTDNYDIPSNNMISELAKKIIEELEAVEIYRVLLFSFLNLELRDMILEIITDEQAHTQKLNYLFSKYNC